MCVCVCVCPLQKPRTNGLPALPPPRTRKAMRERDCERKNLAMARSTTACGLWIECDLGLWTESDLNSFLSASARRPSNKCTGEEEVERAQTCTSQIGDLVAHFKRLETLRASSPFLSKSLKKALLYRCKKAKVRTCMATVSKRIPGLVMAKLCLPASSCVLLLPSFQVVWRVASNGRFLFLNGCRERTDPE